MLRDMSTVPPGKLMAIASQPARIFPGALDKTTQPEAVYAGTYTGYLGATEGMDDDVAYEATRIVYEHAVKRDFDSWHFIGQNITPEYFPTWSYSEKLMHPGALKYFNDNGIPVNNIQDLLPS